MLQLRFLRACREESSLFRKLSLSRTLKFGVYKNKRICKVPEREIGHEESSSEASCEKEQSEPYRRRISATEIFADPFTLKEYLKAVFIKKTYLVGRKLTSLASWGSVVAAFNPVKEESFVTEPVSSEAINGECMYSESRFEYGD